MQPLAIFFGTPVPERLQALCDLMDTNLRLLLRNGKEPLESRSPDEEQGGSREQYGNNTRETLAAVGRL